MPIFTAPVSLLRVRSTLGSRVPYTRTAQVGPFRDRTRLEQTVWKVLGSAALPAVGLFTQTMHIL